MATETPRFDPVAYKETTTQQWQAAAAAWHQWGPTLATWLNPATELMFEMARIGPGHRVLDVAAGAGGANPPRRAARWRLECGARHRYLG